MLGLMFISLSCSLRGRSTMEDDVREKTDQVIQEHLKSDTIDLHSDGGYLQAGGYRLQSGDKLQLYFQHTPEHNLDLNIRIDGAVSTPYGELIADGMTIAELEDSLAELYSVALIHPKPSVRLVQIAQRFIYVFGEISKPNRYSFEPGIDLLSALAMAGGSLRTANLKNVIVIRVNGTNQYSFEAIDLSDIFSDDNQTVPYWLQPRDIVIVTTTLIADLGIFVDQYINQFLPPIDSYTRGRYYWKLISTQD
jgi:protein involved in polysaccharide export with SLBB domain